MRVRVIVLVLGLRFDARRWIDHEYGHDHEYDHDCDYEDAYVHAHEFGRRW